jgi:hypothetical protein
MESKNIKARYKYNFSFKLKVIKFAEEKGKHAAAKYILYFHNFTANLSFGLFSSLSQRSF